MSDTGKSAILSLCFSMGKAATKLSFNRNCDKLSYFIIASGLFQLKGRDKTALIIDVPQRFLM
jgi:hypothetical protein